MGNLKPVSIYCWGKNNCGELSIGNNENVFSPIKNKFFKKHQIKQIHSSKTCSVFLTDNNIYTCGNVAHHMKGNKLRAI